MSAGFEILEGNDWRAKSVAAKLIEQSEGAKLQQGSLNRIILAVATLQW